MQLPRIKFPPGQYDINTCCNHPTYIDRVQVEVRFLENPPHTINRYVTISKWQCYITKDHHGYDWVTTNWRLDAEREE